MPPGESGYAAASDGEDVSLHFDGYGPNHVTKNLKASIGCVTTRSIWGVQVRPSKTEQAKIVNISFIISD